MSPASRGDLPNATNNQLSLRPTLGCVPGSTALAPTWRCAWRTPQVVAQGQRLCGAEDGGEQKRRARGGRVASSHAATAAVAAKPFHLRPNRSGARLPSSPELAALGGAQPLSVLLQRQSRHPASWHAVNITGCANAQAPRLHRPAAHQPINLCTCLHTCLKQRGLPSLCERFPTTRLASGMGVGIVPRSQRPAKTLRILPRTPWKASSPPCRKTPHLR